MTKIHEMQLEFGEMRMLRVSLGVTRKANITNGFVLGILKADTFDRMSVSHLDDDNFAEKVLEMHLPVKRKRERIDVMHLDVA